MRIVAAFLMIAALAMPLFANAPPPENQPSPAINLAEAPVNAADLPPMPAQERDAAVSQGMLLATMAVVLVVLAAVGGVAVYVTRRAQAAPQIKDM